MGVLGHNRIIEFIKRVGVSSAIFLGAFIAAFLSASNFAPVSDSSATNVNLENSQVGHYLNVNTTGTIDFQLSAGMSKVKKDTISIGTNSRSGYKVYISSPEGVTNDFVQEDNSGKKIAHSSATADSPASLSRNTWGYVPGRTNSRASARTYTDNDAEPGAESGAMIGMPRYEDANMVYSNEGALEGTDNAVDIFYGVTIDTATAAGQYSASVLYTIASEAETWGDASIAPANQKSLAAGGKVTIATDIYPGLGVSDFGEVTVKIGGNDCTSVTPVISESGNLNIECIAPSQAKYGKYDVSVSVGKYHRDYTIKKGYEYVYENIEIMQNFNCFSLDINETVRLRDIRDGHIYRVKRLEDGNCWMLEDLQIMGPRTLTSEDTDIPSGSFTLGEADQSRWCQDNNSECDDQSKYYDNTSEGYGALYNWYTATGGTGVYATSGNAVGSICPKGWHLPTTSGDRYSSQHGNQYQGVILVYDKEKVREDSHSSGGYTVNTSPMELSTSGRIGYVGQMELQGRQGYYWLGTASPNTYYGYSGYQEAYYVRIDSEESGFSFSTSNGIDEPKYYGMAVRCVSEDRMSNFSCSDIPEIEGTKELLDLRTGQSYNIVKAKDGKCWAASNQKLSAHNTSGVMNYHDTINNAYRGYAVRTSNNNWCSPGDASCSLDNYSFVLDSDIEGYGSYYGWKLASTVSSLAGDDVDLTTKTSKYSFCPSNWHTPTKEEWQTLYGAYGSNAKELLESPLDIEFAGYHLGNETLSVGKEAYFWSSSYEDDDNAYAFRVNKAGASVEKYNIRYGFNLRCVASN